MGKNEHAKPQVCGDVPRSADTPQSMPAVPSGEQANLTGRTLSRRRPHLRLLTGAPAVSPPPARPQNPTPDSPDETPASAAKSTKLSLTKEASQRSKINFEALRKGWKTVASPVGITGIAVETAWHAAHAALYPFGLGDDSPSDSPNYSTDRLQPKQRAMVVANVEATETPIILLHGMIDNRSIFTRLRRHLQRQGFSRVSTVNYSPFTTDVRNAAQVLAEHIAKVVEDTGCEQVHVVGHSLGGLIARYYVHKMGGDRHVDTLITLGTPHQGTLAANIWFGSLVKQLRPGSDLLAELESPRSDENPCRTKFICYWSDLDHLVLPSRHGRITQPGLNVKNILVRGVGHMTLPIQPRLIHDICHTLGKLQQPGDSLHEESTAEPDCAPDTRQDATAADEHVA